MYLGLHNTAKQVVKAAIEEGVDGIGVSFLSGQHLTQVRKLLEAMQAGGLKLPVFCGGVIPAEDARTLRDLGVAAVVPPGTLSEELLTTVGAILGRDSGAKTSA